MVPTHLENKAVGLPHPENQESEMNDLLFFSLLLFGIMCLGFSAYQYFSPKLRLSELATELFRNKSHYSSGYLPGESTWTTGNNLAIWKRRRSKSYSVVKHGRIRGSQTIFEVGLGRMTVLNEFEDLASAVHSLLDLRARETEQLQKAQEQRDREEALAETQRRLGDEKRKHWAHMERELDQFLGSDLDWTWRPEPVSIPKEISLQQAWEIVTLSLDEMLSVTQSERKNGDLLESVVLIEGFVGSLDWFEDDHRLNEALIWHSVLSVLAQPADGVRIFVAVLDRFARLNKWDTFSAFAILWGRIAVSDDAPGGVSSFRRLAISAATRHWRLSSPETFLAAEMPPELNDWCQLVTDTQSKPGLCPTTSHESRIQLQRVDQFTMLLAS